MNGAQGVIGALHPALVEVRSASLARAIATPVNALLLAAGSLLLARRIGGALVEPLPSAALVGVALVVSMLALAIRALAPVGRRWTIAGALPSVWLILFGIALSLGGARWPAVAGLWALVAAEEAWSWHGLRHWPRRSSLQPRVAPRRAPVPAEPVLEEPTAVEPVALEAADLESIDEELAGEQVTQQLTRSVSADGSESLRGWLMARFAPGQRTTYLHVAFCPPFASVPQMEYQQGDGPSARIKLGQLLPYGARFELKLSEPGPAEVLVELSAVGQPLAISVGAARASP